MAKRATIRKPKRARPKVHYLNGIPPRKPRAKRVDPTGRLDIAALGLYRTLIGRSADPMVRVVGRNAEPVVEQLAAQYLGPRNKTARTITSTVRKGLGMLAQIEAEKLKGVKG